MPDYEKMYFELFNAISRSVEVLNSAQLATEDIYMSSAEALNMEKGQRPNVMVAVLFL